MQSMRLSYRQYDGDFVLSWRSDVKGAKLLMSGPGYPADGFSIGIYDIRTIKNILAALQAPMQPDKFTGIVPAIYTHTKPTKFARGQGHETRLAVIASEYQVNQAWPKFHHFHETRIVSVHEQGERVSRDITRFMGRYRFEDFCAFLVQGTNIIYASYSAIFQEELRRERKERANGLLGTLQS